MSGVPQHVTDLNDPAHRGHSNHVITTNGVTAQRIWVPETPILESVRNELLNICQSHSNECCGFIDSQWEVWKIPNTHEEPYHNFYMDPDDANPVLDHLHIDREETVMGIWHTHPNNHPWPTPRDIHGWPDLRLGLRYFIVTNKEVLEWELVK